MSARKTGRSHHTNASRKITGRSGCSKCTSRRVPSINGMSNAQKSGRSGYSNRSSSCCCCCCCCSSHVASSWRKLKSQNRKLEKALRHACVTHTDYFFSSSFANVSIAFIHFPKQNRYSKIENSFFVKPKIVRALEAMRV